MLLSDCTGNARERHIFIERLLGKLIINNVCVGFTEIQGPMHTTEIVKLYEMQPLILRLNEK